MPGFRAFPSGERPKCGHVQDVPAPQITITTRANSNPGYKGWISVTASLGGKTIRGTWCLDRLDAQADCARQFGNGLYCRTRTGSWHQLCRRANRTWCAKPAPAACIEAINAEMASRGLPTF
jgi:hypothetical protein